MSADSAALAGTVGITDEGFSLLMAAETARLDPATTAHELERHKDILERLNVSGDH